MVVGANRATLVAPVECQMRGTINMDNTDFKLGVAYLFDLRKDNKRNIRSVSKKK